MSLNVSLLKSFSSSQGVKWIVGGWSFFLAENLILSENRTTIINKFGKDTYHLVYNILSTSATGTIIYGYMKYGRNKDPLPNFKKIGKKGIFASFIFSSLGLIGFSQLIPKFQNPFIINTDDRSSNNNNNNQYNVDKSKSNNSILMVRCPMDFKPSDVPIDGIYGMERISRHSTFWSLGFLCLSTSFSIYMPHIVMGAFPIVLALIGGEHQDSRHRRNMGGTLSKEKDEKTSNIPFVAFLSGNQQWSSLLHEIKWTNAALASLVALGLAFKKIK